MDESRLATRIAIYRASGGEEINERVHELAVERDVTMAQIALAWLLHQDAVDAPIVGTTSVDHLEEADDRVLRLSLLYDARLSKRRDLVVGVAVLLENRVGVFAENGRWRPQVVCYRREDRWRSDVVGFFPVCTFDTLV